MKYIQVAYAAAYMDLSKMFSNPADFIDKDGYIIYDSSATSHVIVDKNQIVTADQIRAFVERAQKSKYGRAYVVLSGVLKDDSTPGSDPLIF